MCPERDEAPAPPPRPETLPRAVALKLVAEDEPPPARPGPCLPEERPAPPAKRPPAEATLGLRVEALKKVATVLLRELEVLSVTTPLRGAREIDLNREVRRYEADLICCALVVTGGRQRRAARLLNTSVATLNAKIKRYGLAGDELLTLAAAAGQTRRHAEAGAEEGA